MTDCTGGFPFGGTSRRKQQPFLYRFLGILIGSGFIVPGVSGGALAAIFGIYERIIGFLANLTKNFKENILYFIPAGLGGAGIVLFLSGSATIS